MNRRATLGGFVCFFLVGVTFATYGPALPAFRSAFHITVATSSLIIGASGAGAAAGTLLAAALSRPLDMRTRLILSTLIMGAGSLMIGVAQTWSLIVIGGFCFGVGSGGIAGVYQILFAHSFGHRSGTMLSLVNGAFGVGSIGGPLILGLLPASLLRPRFVVESVVIFAAVALVAAAPKRLGYFTDIATTRRTDYKVVFLFAIAMFFAFGVEQSVGGWETSYLHAQGVAAAAAISATALFWGAYTFMRVAGAGLVERLGPNRIPKVGFAVAGLAVLLASVSRPIAFLYFALAGAGIGLILPSLLAWFARSTRTSDGVGTLVVAAGNIGTMSLPVLTGAVAGALGLGAVPFICTGLAAIAFVVCLALQRSLRADAEGIAPSVGVSA